MELTELELSSAARCDAALISYPHGAAAELVAELRSGGVAVVDVSADFRLHGLTTYERTYGAHSAPELVGDAAYGLTELHREKIAGAKLVANPGCYPTAALLALAPLAEAGLIAEVASAASGVSGAGREGGDRLHFVNVDENFGPYGVEGHRHRPEIEQELAALGVEGRVTFVDLFGPLPEGYVTVPRDDPEALRDAVGERTAAVLIEPVQGEAGVFPIQDEVLLAAREACDAGEAILIFDEVQAGMGRTGSLWAYEQLPVRPDALTAAKALGGGLPVGACITVPELGGVLGRGDHGSTFAGAPVAAAAALAALEVIDDPELLRGTRELGAGFRDALAELDGVAEARGRGLMVGVSLEEGLDAERVAARALAAGLVINVPCPGMLRFLLPLVVGSEEIEIATGALRELIG